MNIKEIIKGKVTDVRHGTLVDEENNLIVNVRGWGRLQYLENREQKHDFLAKFIFDAINEKLERETK